LIEAGVDVDFPAAYREEAGLDSILQTAGRCNREGKRPIQDSIVSIFKLEGQQPLTMLAQNLGAFSLVRRKYPQALDSPEATQAYFQYLYDLKGRPALDSKGILNAFTNTLNASVMPFAQVAELFRLIESPTKTVYIPLADGESLCRRLQSGEVSKELFRELGAYAVSVYPQHFDALSSNGALELIDQNTAILINPDCYRSQTGLQQKVEGGTAPLHGRPLCSVACQ
jgi:CRISPR-associated endonuclease/helicase Cas3